MFDINRLKAVKLIGKTRIVRRNPIRRYAMRLLERPQSPNFNRQEWADSVLALEMVNRPKHIG